MELKEVAEYLGLEDFDAENASLDEFKTKFTTKFVDINEAVDNEEIKKKISGEVYGKITTLAKREFGYKNGDVNDKDLGEIFKMVKGSYEERINSLDSQLKDSSSDERVKNLTKDLEAANGIVSEKETLLEQLNGQIEELKNNYTSEITNYKVNHLLSEEKGKIKFKSDMSDIERVGFDNFIKSNYKLGLEKKEGSEVEELVIYNKDGGRVRNTNAASGYLGVYDVLNQVALTNKLVAVNNGGGGNGVPDPPKKDTEPQERKLSYAEMEARKKAQANLDRISQ